MPQSVHPKIVMGKNQHSKDRLFLTATECVPPLNCLPCASNIRFSRAGGVNSAVASVYKWEQAPPQLTDVRARVPVLPMLCFACIMLTDAICSVAV